MTLRDARKLAPQGPPVDAPIQAGDLPDVKEQYVFTITDDRISGALAAAHQRGVKVRIVTDDEKAQDLGSDIQTLHRAGIPVVTDQGADHMHHKFAIFDARQLLTGSFNWTRSASERNLENFVVTNDAGLLRSFQKEFERLWTDLRRM